MTIDKFANSGNFKLGSVFLKRKNIVERNLSRILIIHGRTISSIQFDLRHINFGWDATKRDYNNGPPRQNFSEDDIVRFFEQLDTLVQVPEEQLSKLKTVDKRFCFYIYEQDRRLKMIVDFMKNELTVVVTIY